MPRIDLLSPCVPVGWRDALLGRLGEDVEAALNEVDRGASSENSSLVGWLDIHSVDLVECKLTTGFPGACYTWAFTWVISGVLTA